MGSRGPSPERSEYQPFLGRRLRELREARSLSGSQVALAIGVQLNHLYCVERGEAMLGLDAIGRAAEYFSVQICSLLQRRAAKRRKRT
jgi:transcriptional regulator with XRE-family HTH domain